MTPARDKETKMGTMFGMIRTAAAALAFAMLGGCAERATAWNNPELSRDFAGRDLADCRRWADDQVDPDRSAEGRLSDGNPFRAGERQDLRRRIDSLVGACMQAKGYTRGR